MSLNRYTMLVLGILVATLTLAWPIALRRLDVASRWAVAIGVTLAVLNTTAAHAVTLWASRRSTTVFLRALLGGMALRMALLLAAVVVSVLLLGLPKLPLVFSLLFYFSLFLAMELTVFHLGSRTSAGAAR